MKSIREELLEGYYTVKEVSERLGYTLSHTRNKLKEANLLTPVPLFKGLQLVDKVEFEEWVQRLLKKG